MVSMKSSHEIEIMREAGRIVARALQRVTDAAAPGVSLRELDAIAESCIKEHDATPSFLHYQPRFADSPFPATLCLSVNDAIVHGIPDDSVLRDGDVLSVDCGARFRGYHGDAAVTVPVGTVSEAATRLMEVTRTALERGIAAAVPGARIGDISAAVQETARSAGYGILSGCTGHGIGTALHEGPDVPNTGRAGRGFRVREGLTIAIEPMFIAGGRDDGVLRPDEWTIATPDGSLAAHFEHTVAVTADGPVILTAL